MILNCWRAGSPLARTLESGVRHNAAILHSLKPPPPPVPPRRLSQWLKFVVSMPKAKRARMRGLMFGGLLVSPSKNSYRHARCSPSTRSSCHLLLVQVQLQGRALGLDRGRGDTLVSWALSWGGACCVVVYVWQLEVPKYLS